MNRKITRRKFVQTTAAATATVAIGPLAGGCNTASPYDPKDLPTVKLGKTGDKTGDSHQYVKTMTLSAEAQKGASYFDLWAHGLPCCRSTDRQSSHTGRVLLSSTARRLTLRRMRSVEQPLPPAPMIRRGHAVVPDRDPRWGQKTSPASRSPGPRRLSGRGPGRNGGTEVRVGIVLKRGLRPGPDAKHP